MARKSSPRFPNMVLCIRFEKPTTREYGFGHVKAFVQVADPQYAGTDYYLRTLYSYEKSNGGKYAHVHLSSQTDAQHIVSDEPMYGVKLEWEDSDAGLSELKRGVSALTDIENRLDKMTAEYGRPASFGIYVQRLAKALGVGMVEMPSVSGSKNLINPDQVGSIVDSRLWSWKTEILQSNSSVA